jgi:hypothetical protein
LTIVPSAATDELEEERKVCLEDTNDEERVDDPTENEPLEGRHVGGEDASEGHGDQKRDQDLRRRERIVYRF